MKMKQFVAACLFVIGFQYTSNAQVEQWSVQVKIHPDQENVDGCYISTDEVFLAMDQRNAPGWMFNLQSCKKAEDISLYFDRISSPDTRIVLLNAMDVEAMLGEQTTEQEINAELAWAGNLVPIQLRFQTSKTRIHKSTGKVKVFMFEVDAAALKMPNEGKIQFTLTFTQKN